MTPFAAQRTALDKNCGAYARAVGSGKFLDAANEVFLHMAPLAAVSCSSDNIFLNITVQIGEEG